MKLRVSLAVVVALLSTLTISGLVPGNARAQNSSSSTVLTTQHTAYGDVLFTVDGKALYMLTYDTVGTAAAPAKSACADKCAAAWPPLLAAGPHGPFDVTGDVQMAGLGTIQRSDGTYQVTYFGWPLYTFVADKSPGQTNGENVANFNGLWYLLSPSGRPNAGVATVSVEQSSVGTVLSAPTAFNTYRSLYLLTADPSNGSTCFGGCARFWPPLLTTAPPVAGSGVAAAGLGTLRRPDGTLQVTYFGRPLYFFAPDMPAGGKSGLTNGEDDVDAFNLGTWYLVGPSGAAQAGPATIGSKSTDVGTVLTYGPASNPAYAFTTDKAGSSTCAGLCARIWTPVLSGGAPQAAAGSGVSQADLGTIQRSDGTQQVTYHGRPLYLFARDYLGIGGQGMATFGGSFQLMQPSGVVTTALPSTRPVVSVPQLASVGQGTSGAFTIAFNSAAPGQGLVAFAPGSGCAGLVELATQDAAAGTMHHMVTVTGNDLPGTVGDTGIQPGTTYSFEVLIVSASGAQVDDNKGKCYSVTVPQS